MTNRIAEQTGEDAPLPRFGQVIFTGEEMAVICVATSILTSMVVGDIEAFQDNLVLMKEEQERIAEALSTLLPKLALADQAVPFLRKSGEVS